MHRRQHLCLFYHVARFVIVIVRYTGLLGLHYGSHFEAVASVVIESCGTFLGVAAKQLKNCGVLSSSAWFLKVLSVADYLVHCPVWRVTFTSSLIL